MKTRIDLDAVLVGVMVRAGYNNANAEDRVYFQPPETIEIKYPCIIYSLSNLDMIHADNSPYIKNKSYQITVVDKNPDSVIPGIIEELPMVKFSRSYTADNLHHFVYTIYY